MKSLRDYINIVDETLKEAENPYTGADAEKFARLSPEDQAWYTKGGGKPDLNDPYIAARAPNKGKLGPAPAAPAAAAPATAAPAAAPAAGPDTSTAAGAMAAAPTGTGGPTAGANDEGNAGEEEAKAYMQAQQAAAAGGAANVAQGLKPPAAGASAEGDAGEKQAQAAAAAAPTAQAATPAPAPAAAPDQSDAETARLARQNAAAAPPPTPATPAAPANRDAMPFGKAFADAKAKGEKEFTWKGKKYAVAMAKPAAKPAQAATPAAQPGMWDRFKNWATGGGKAGTPAGGTAPTGDIGTQIVAPESVQMNEFVSSMDTDIDKIMKNAGLDSLNDKEAPGANIPNPPSFEKKEDPKELLKKMPELELANLSGDEAKDLLMQMKKLAGM